MTRSSARWLAGAGLVALAVTTLATPAAAAPPSIAIQSVSSTTVRSGETVRVRFRVTNNDRGTQRAFVAVSGGLRCTAGCAATRDLRRGQSASFTATVVAPSVGPGEQSGRNLAVTVRIGRQTGFAHQQILVSGAEKPATSVSQVSGRVRDAGGKAVGGAAVGLKDSAGHVYEATSDGDGRFSISSGDSRPIAAGPITVAAGKDGYRTARATVRGKAGAAATVRLTLAAVAPVATPSPTPPSPSPEASAPVAAAEAPTGEPTATSLGTLKSAGDEGDGPLLFMILGGILVAAGLGALVMMLTRRRHRPEPVVAPGPGGLADAPTEVFRAVR